MGIKTLGAGLALLLLTSTVQAEPRFARLYKQQFGYVPSCNACHKDGGGSDLNVYGEAFKSAGGGMAAFQRIASMDSDGDGVGNQAEAQSKSNPGHATSTPRKPGDWLSTANLIPREVQSLFPGVAAYKPLDAILTEAEQARAAALGVSLSAEDETTIYVPVKDGKAAGTAIIVPASHQGQQFFVLLATDRQLRVTHAQALHVGGLKQAEQAALYQYAIGRSVDDLPLDGEGLAQAVALALKKAGAILHVRLKKG